MSNDDTTQRVSLLGKRDGTSEPLSRCVCPTMYGGLTLAVSHAFADGLRPPARTTLFRDASLSMALSLADSVGAFVLDDTRTQFCTEVSAYSGVWSESLAVAFKRYGFGVKEATESSEDILPGIQGALLFAWISDDARSPVQTLTRLLKRTDVIPRG